VVLNTIGELAQVYEIATIAFVGGSLVNTGGHNILEPAIFGRPIVFGPYMQNFAEIAQAFLQNGAAVQVPHEGALDRVFVDLMADPVTRARLGAAAKALMEANRGARQRTLTAVTDVLRPDDGSRGAVLPFRVVH
jgi:3-deoxy-D-manno-octulosonic-acid transferase